MNVPKDCRPVWQTEDDHYPEDQQATGQQATDKKSGVAGP